MKLQALQQRVFRAVRCRALSERANGARVKERSFAPAAVCTRFFKGAQKGQDRVLGFKAARRARMIDRAVATTNSIIAPVQLALSLGQRLIIGGVKLQPNDLFGL
jgi:hypothetical protein